MNGLCSDVILEVMNFLDQEEIHSSVFKKYIADHTRQRTALSTIHNAVDLELARMYPKADYDLFVYTLEMYYELEDADYPRVVRLTSSIQPPPFFTNLQYLNISHSHFTFSLPPELSGLKELNCSHTPLLKLPNEYTQLAHLDASHSRVYEIPEAYVLLEKLNVYGSRVSRLSPLYTKLRELNCGNTHVGEIPDSYSNLERLDCRLSLVKRIPPTLLKLKWIDCSNSRVDHVPEVIRRLPLTFFREKSMFQLNYFLSIQ